MRFFIIFFFAVFAFSCNTQSFESAYKDYYKYHQKYLNAVLNDNKKEKIRYLKELIQCGNFLKFNVSPFEKTLKKLTKKTFVKIISYDPLKIKTSGNYRVYEIKSKKFYTKVIDIYNSVFPKNYLKKNYANITFKVAQYNKSIVRAVLYSKKPIKVKIKKLKNTLTIYFENNKNTQFSTLFKRKKIIVIDPGHGGKDSGGIGVGRRMEKTAVLKIARYLKYYLQKEGYIVYLTRNSDIFRKLKWRTHFANRKKADLFISIHCNIAPQKLKYPRGIETYYLSPADSKRSMRVAKIENKEINKLNNLDQKVILKFLNKDKIISSTKFAIDVQRGMIKNLRKYFKYVKDGGVRPAPFWVLTGTQMPAILIETGYLTNPMEAKRLFNPSYQRYLAQGIAKGVKEYFRKNP